MVKLNKNKSASRRRNRKAYFTAPIHVRRVLMSSHLGKELRVKYNVRSMPIRRDDEVRVMSGAHKGREGKVVTCYRKKMVCPGSACAHTNAPLPTHFRAPSKAPIPKGIHTRCLVCIRKRNRILLLWCFSTMHCNALSFQLLPCEY